MKKRGFIISWQNRRWIDNYSAYTGGQNDQNISAGGSGVLPDYMTFSVKGWGYDYWYDDDDEPHQYVSEVAFCGPAMKTAGGSVFRFVVIFRRSSHTATASTGYFCLVDCDSAGKVLSAGSGDNSWESAVGNSGTAGKAYQLYKAAAPVLWEELNSRIPYIETEAYNMMINSASTLYNTVHGEQFSGTLSAELLTISYNSTEYWNALPLYWADATTDVQEIISRAQSLSGFKYWYGGAGQVASESLANSLRASYSSIWTTSYYSKALNDIGQRVGDCSYLVNYAYGIASEGNHGPGTSQYLARWSRWSGTPKDGMIAWRNGHTGIYYSGKTLELVGIDYDYQEKAYDSAKWSAILYDPNRTY